MCISISTFMWILLVFPSLWRCFLLWQHTHLVFLLFFDAYFFFHFLFLSLFCTLAWHSVHLHFYIHLTLFARSIALFCLAQPPKTEYISHPNSSEFIRISLLSLPHFFSIVAFCFFMHIIVFCFISSSCMCAFCSFFFLSSISNSVQKCSHH